MRKNNRPLPGDFAERARAGATIDALRRHYRAGTWVINRWIEEIGGKPRARRKLPPKPVPADFAHFAAIETVEQLVKRYQRGTSQIARWRREISAGGPSIRPARPPKSLPEDFVEVAPRLSTRELVERFGVCKVTVLKWCARAGVTPRQVKPGPATLGAMGRAKAAPIAQHRDTSRAGQAADYLRRFGPVVRCDAVGRFNPTGTHWRRGSSILTADEVIQRAERNGWNPDAWRMVA